MRLFHTDDCQLIRKRHSNVLLYLHHIGIDDLNCELGEFLLVALLAHPYGLGRRQPIGDVRRADQGLGVQPDGVVALQVVGIADCVVPVAERTVTLLPVAHDHIDAGPVKVGVAQLIVIQVNGVDLLMYMMISQMFVL